MLGTTRTVIVDEIHAMVGGKRGLHLAVSLERLESLAGKHLTRIGLSATQKPIEEVARFLVGTRGINADGEAECTIIDSGHVRDRDLAIEVPGSPLEAVMSGDVWTEVYDRLAELVSEHRTTLVFVNTRRHAERVARHLSERIGENNVTAHHGSMAKELRFDAESRLKNGALKALIATASLELGIDIGDVDLVCQLGAVYCCISAASGPIRSLRRRHPQGPVVSAVARRSRRVLRIVGCRPSPRAGSIADAREAARPAGSADCRRNRRPRMAG
jgi:ATP-dependent Lhr-like helicase